MKALTFIYTWCFDGWLNLWLHLFRGYLFIYFCWFIILSYRRNFSFSFSESLPKTTFIFYTYIVLLIIPSRITHYISYYKHILIYSLPYKLRLRLIQCLQEAERAWMKNVYKMVKMHFQAIMMPYALHWDISFIVIFHNVHFCLLCLTICIFLIIKTFEVKPKK